MSLPEKQILKIHDSTLPITHCSSVDPFQIRALNFNPEPWRSLTAYRRSDTEEEGNNPRDPQVVWNRRMVALGEPRLFKLRCGFKLILLSHFIFCRLPSYTLHLAHTLEGTESIPASRLLPHLHSAPEKPNSYILNGVFCFCFCNPLSSNVSSSRPLTTILFSTLSCLFLLWHLPWFGSFLLHCPTLLLRVSSMRVIYHGLPGL
nr:uncharacterized protein LOC123288857 [Equus asinus]